MRTTILSLIILAGLVSCKKENLDVDAFWNCNKTQNLDSLSVTSKLEGSWKWAKQYCFWTDKTKKADRNIKVTFNHDHTFSVTENASILTQGTWKVIPAGTGAWQLETSASSEFLPGRILFCDNQLLLNDSYIDGCDNLFYRSN